MDKVNNTRAFEEYVRSQLHGASAYQDGCFVSFGSYFTHKDAEGAAASGISMGQYMLEERP